jgi:hypothetical protein
MKIRPMRTITAVVAVAVSLAMLSETATAEKYFIDGQVWGWYQQYLRNIGNGNKPGAFAISKDGQGAFYSWCQDIRCVAGTTYSHDAVSGCERHFETECVVFAVRDDIKVEYEVIASAAEPIAPPQLAPAEVTRLGIAPSVQADIDAYLNNAGNTGRMWALAIAKDGSAVASASCPASGSYSGGLACDPVKGSAQELAKREAIKRCGGPGDCVLLYVGAQKQGNIELVAN